MVIIIAPIPMVIKDFFILDDKDLISIFSFSLLLKLLYPAIKSGLCLTKKPQKIKIKLVNNPEKSITI